MFRIILTLIAAAALWYYGWQVWETASQTLAATFYWIFPD